MSPKSASRLTNPKPPPTAVNRLLEYSNCNAIRAASGDENVTVVCLDSEVALGHMGPMSSRCHRAIGWPSSVRDRQRNSQCRPAWSLPAARSCAAFAALKPLYGQLQRKSREVHTQRQNYISFGILHTSMFGAQLGMIRGFYAWCTPWAEHPAGVICRARALLREV